MQIELHGPGWIERFDANGKDHVVTIAEGFLPGLLQAVGGRIGNIGGSEIDRFGKIEGRRHAGFARHAPIGQSLAFELDFDTGPIGALDQRAGRNQPGAGIGTRHPGRSAVGTCRGGPQHGKQDCSDQPSLCFQMQHHD